MPPSLVLYSCVKMKDHYLLFCEHLRHEDLEAFKQYKEAFYVQSTVCQNQNGLYGILLYCIKCINIL